MRTFFIPFTLEEFERRFSYSYDEPAPKIYDFSGYKDATIYSNRSELSKGTVVFECLVGNKVIHRSWVATCREGCGVYQHYYPASLDDGNTAYGGFTITSQSYRGKGVSTYVHYEMYRYLRERGFSKVVHTTIKDAVATNRTHVKLGSHFFGEGHSVRLLLLFNFRWIRRRTRVTIC